MISDFVTLLQNSPASKAGLFFIFGACIGSFATALQYRLPRKLNWTTEPSRCPSCGHRLGVPDLVPVLSWVFLGGKCRHCGTQVHWRYPAIEIAFGLIFALISFAI